jgi:uncharacterized protein YkwD
MLVILAIALAWLFLLVLALAILRAAGSAERAAEERLRAPRYRRVPNERARKSVTTAVMLAALPLAGSAAVAPDADAQSCRGARSASGLSAPSATVCLINRQRRAHGLAPLVANARLGRAAQRHARDMVSRDYFSHDTPEGVSFFERLRRAGYARGCTAWAGGETLAWGSGAQATPASRVAAWMKSAPHRAILLGRFREVGIGVVSGSPGTGGAGATYAGEFGRRRC